MTENIAANILEIASKLPENWLIGCDSSELLLKIERQVRELTKIGNTGAPKVCLSEPEPINFIASFIAACATKCQIFLCNPNWVQQEWQQVFDLIQPDRILGKSALQNLAEINSIAPPFNNYKNHPKLPITNYQLPITDSQFPIPNSQLP